MSAANGSVVRGVGWIANRLMPFADAASEELPLGRLLNLKAGDVIPICLPSHIPVTVAGRLFAQGTVGEANGRAAICIEKIEQGSLTYE